MVNNKKVSILLGNLFIALSVFTTGCGNENKTPVNQSSYSTSATQSGNCDCNCKPGEPCQCTCQAGENTFNFDININFQGGAVVSNPVDALNPTPAAKPSKTMTTPAKAPIKDTTAPVAPTKPPATDKNEKDKENGRKILDKVLNTIRGAKAFDIAVRKAEENIDTGKLSDTDIQLYARNPGDVVLELVKSYTPGGSDGVRIKYAPGDSKVKVRPAGLASFVTPTLDMNDERVVGPNGYTPNDVDIFGLVKRFSDPVYEAVLEGKTKAVGMDLYVLKLTTEKNTLDDRISYETLGFDPKTMTIRLWEAYTAGKEKPYLRMTMSKFELLDSIDDKKMKL